LVSTIPESAFGIHSRRGANRLPLGSMPSFSRLTGEAWKNFAPSPLDRFRIALIGALQRFLRRQPQLGEQLSHSSQSKPNVKLLCEKVCHNGSRPQAKVQAILARIFAVHPTKHLLLLARRQTAWPPGYRLCMQRLQPDARLRRRLDPFVDRRAVEAQEAITEDASSPAQTRPTAISRMTSSVR
jgi:hypothetical protein